MTKDTLLDDIAIATKSLLEIARGISWNKISDNCLYIISEIKDPTDNFQIQRNLRKLENRRKIPCSLSEIIPKLQEKFNEFYDVNLYIDKAQKNLTIIDIRYYSRNSLEIEYREKVSLLAPMLHCKVGHPPYRVDGKKIDINWGNGNLRHKWNSFLFKTKVGILGYPKR